MPPWWLEWLDYEFVTGQKNFIFISVLKTRGAALQQADNPILRPAQNQGCTGE
jgi:hypothetical protein